MRITDSAIEVHFGLRLLEAQPRKKLGGMGNRLHQCGVKTAGTGRDLAMAVSVGRLFQSTILQVGGGGGGGVGELAHVNL